jgi:hypothetical protein
MASAQEYEEYKRQLKALQEAQKATTFSEIGGIRGIGRELGGAIKGAAGNIMGAAQELWTGKPPAATTPQPPPTAPAPAKLPTYSKPSVPTTVTPQTAVQGASSDIMGPPDMTVSSGQVPKRFVLGSGPTNTIYGGALVRKPSVDKYGLNNNSNNSVYTPEQIRAIGDSVGNLFAPQSPPRPIFGNTTSAAEIAKAAAEYKAFMEGSLKRYNEFLARTGYKSGPQGTTRRERQAQLDRDAALAQQTAARAWAAAENDKNRQAELQGRQIIADAQVGAAKEGTTWRERQAQLDRDAALLKEYVEAWSLATEAEKPALMAKIMEIGGGGGAQAAPQTFASEADAKKANLPKGTKIIINGRTAIVS